MNKKGPTIAIALVVQSTDEVIGVFGTSGEPPKVGETFQVPEGRGGPYTVKELHQVSEDYFLVYVEKSLS